MKSKKIIASIVLSITLLQTPTDYAMDLLKYGSRGQAVYSLQESLNKLGYSTDIAQGIDGIFCQATRNAVISLQKHFGIVS